MVPTLTSIGVHVLSEKIRKIAVVEDDEDILVLLTGYFVQKGHEVLDAFSNATLNLFENEKPDLYVIDYILSGSNKNGLEIAVDILGKSPKMPILFLTAFEHIDAEISKNTVFRDKNIGILIKPVKLLEIENLISDLLVKA